MDWTATFIAPSIATWAIDRLALATDPAIGMSMQRNWADWKLMVKLLGLRDQNMGVVRSVALLSWWIATEYSVRRRVQPFDDPLLGRRRRAARRRRYF